jgi:hypothetical protein
MRLLFILSLSLNPHLYAKNVEHLNEALVQDLKKEIQKDDEKFRSSSRSPASVIETPPKKGPFPKHPDKIEKNVKQLGHSQW